jgi:hypothetical protein
MEEVSIWNDGPLGLVLGETYEGHCYVEAFAHCSPVEATGQVQAGDFIATVNGVQVQGLAQLEGIVRTQRPLHFVFISNERWTTQRMVREARNRAQSSPKQRMTSPKQQRQYLLQHASPYAPPHTGIHDFVANPEQSASDEYFAAISGFSDLSQPRAQPSRHGSMRGASGSHGPFPVVQTARAAGVQTASAAGVAVGLHGPVPPSTVVVHRTRRDARKVQGRDGQCVQTCSYKYCRCCLPLCFGRLARGEIFGPCYPVEFTDPAIAMHVREGRVDIHSALAVTHGAGVAYWADAWYFVQQRDHWLGMVYR